MRTASAVAHGVRRSARDLAYVGLGLLLGGVWLCALALAGTVMVVLVGGLIGAPVAVRVLELTARAGALERRLTNRLLCTDLQPPPAVPEEPDAAARLRLLAAAGSAWRAIAWLVLRLPLALLVATILWALALFAVSLGAAPFSGALVGAGPGYQAAALVACVALVLLVSQALWVSSEAHVRLDATLLGPSAREQVVRLEERTAELDLRAGLARDLHDSVGHSVTASLLQASAARQSLERDPAFAAHALEAIEAQSRAALEQLDRVLGTLRAGDRAVPGGSGLEQLDELVARTRTAGIPLSVERRGDLGRLPGPIADEAFRTVQEGLTNVLRHASGARTRVLLARTDRALEVVVENTRGGSLDVARGGGGGGHPGHRRARRLARWRARPRVATGRRLPPPRVATVRQRVTTSIRVLIADDDALVRSGLGMLLGGEDDLEVVGEAADGFEAIRLARETRPDVVLMDVRMPGLDGIAATRRIVSGAEPTPRVLVVTTFEHDAYVYDALRAGASGFVLKRAQRAELAQAVRIVATGESLVFPELTRALVERNAVRPVPGDPRIALLDRLTQREAETLRLLARGASNAEIAEELVVAVHTVKTHVASTLAKLEVRDRTRAVVFAYESGFIRPGE